MFAKVILILHKLQYPIPGFFTFGLWVVTFFSFLMGNSTIGSYLLYFLMLKIVVQFSFIAIVAKKMAAQENLEEIQKYTSHTRMKTTQNGMSNMAGFREMMEKQARNMEQKAQQSSNSRQTIHTPKSNDDYIEYEEVEEEVFYKGLEIGDIVQVNEGTSDPDFPELNLSGYHARIKNLYQEDGVLLVAITWDSISLESMPLKYFRLAKEKELDFFEMILEISEVSKATARDAIADVEKMRQKIRILLADDE